MPPDKTQEPIDRRWWLIPAGLALLVIAAAVVVFGPRLLNAAGGAPLQSIPPFGGTAESGAASGLAELPDVGSVAPDFALTDLNGETVRLSDFEGRPILLNFWATWCAPCRVEMPELARAAADYADRGLVVLPVNQEETAEQVRDFYDELALDLPSLLDSKAEVGMAYGAFFLPSTVIVGPDGLISAYHRGIISSQEIDDYLADILPAGGGE